MANDKSLISVERITEDWKKERKKERWDKNEKYSSDASLRSTENLENKERT